MAIRPFAELGYAGVQLEAIAREVGVTRNLIHHYFPGGKRDLYVEAVRAACAELAGLMDVSRDVPLERKMSANISRYLDQVLDPSPIYVLYARAMRNADGEIPWVCAAHARRDRGGRGAEPPGHRDAARGGAARLDGLRRIRRGRM